MSLSPQRLNTRTSPASLSAFVTAAEAGFRPVGAAPGGSRMPQSPPQSPVNGLLALDVLKKGCAWPSCESITVI